MCIRKNWSNEACIDTLRLGIRYTAAKVLRRAQKVISCFDINTCAHLHNYMVIV